MIKHKLVSKQVAVVDDIICNKCEKSCMRDFGPTYSSEDDVNTEFYGQHIQYIPGYLSTDFSDDNSIHNIDLCEACLFELFHSCKIPPEVV